jgi:hypothetical protein
MTKAFSNAVLAHLRYNLPFADDKELLVIAEILWELMPKFYTSNK